MFVALPKRCFAVVVVVCVLWCDCIDWHLSFPRGRFLGGIKQHQLWEAQFNMVCLAVWNVIPDASSGLKADIAEHSS